MWNETVSAFVDVHPPKKFVSARGDLPEIISKIISENYGSSWIFSNMFNVAEITLSVAEMMSELFQRLK